MVAVLMFALFFTLIFILEMIKSRKEFNQNMEEYNDELGEIKIIASESIRNKLKTHNVRQKYKLAKVNMDENENF